MEISSASSRKPGRPKRLLTPEQAAERTEHRRKQLAEAQARRRQKLTQAFDLAQATSSQLEELRRDLAAAQSIVERQDIEIQGLKRELADAGKTVAPGISLVAPDTRSRARLLMKQIATTETWQGETRERNAIDTRREAERLASLVRQTKAARTAIVKAESELSAIVSEGEKAILEGARLALSQILDAAELAKEQGRRLAKQREDHDESCRVAARKSVREAFHVESVEDKVALILAVAGGRPGLYSSAYDLVSGKAFARTFKDWQGREQRQDILSTTIAAAVRETLERLESKVQGAIKEPGEAVSKASEIRHEIEAKRSALLAEHAGLIERIKTELVARQLEKANQS